MTPANTTDEIEEWRSIDGYDGLYEISSLGRLRSWHRRGYLKKAEHKSAEDPDGARIRRTVDGPTSVCLSVGGVSRVHSVHSLVAEAFIGPRPGGEWIRHNDGDPVNCRATNLRYESRRQCPELQKCWFTKGADERRNIEQIFKSGGEWTGNQAGRSKRPPPPTPPPPPPPPPPRDTRELAREKAIAAMRLHIEVMEDENAPTSQRIKAACRILDRGWGRPKACVEAPATPFSEWTDDELRAFLAQGGLVDVTPTVD